MNLQQRWMIVSGWARTAGYILACTWQFFNSLHLSYILGIIPKSLKVRGNSMVSEKCPQTFCGHRETLCRYRKGHNVAAKSYTDSKINEKTLSCHNVITANLNWNYLYLTLWLLDSFSKDKQNVITPSLTLHSEISPAGKTFWCLCSTKCITSYIM